MSFYVSAIKDVKDGEQKALVLGPFRRHGDALYWKFWVSTQARKIFKDVDHFTTRWGTAHDRKAHRPGVLNPHLNVILDADGYIERVITC